MEAEPASVTLDSKFLTTNQHELTPMKLVRIQNAFVRADHISAVMPSDAQRSDAPYLKNMTSNDSRA